jgi:WD40 repeat protein
MTKPIVAKDWSACLQTLEGHSHGVTSVAWSPDGQQIASASRDGTVKIWNLATGECQTLEGHSHGVTSVAWSPDGQQIASASGDRTVKIWNPATGECQTLEGHSGWVTSVAWSPDGQQIASASGDRTVKIWNPATGECQTLEGHSGWVTSVAWSPDGQQIASASEDGTVKIWNPATGECQTLEEYTFNLYFDVRGHLHTDGGIFDLKLNAPHNNNITPQDQPAIPLQASKYGINETWITYRGQKLLWLPPEYRPSASAISETTIVIGCASGCVLIIKFSKHIHVIQPL